VCSSDLHSGKTVFLQQLLQLKVANNWPWLELKMSDDFMLMLKVEIMDLIMMKYFY
jgi:hypothetical protein